MKIKLLIISLLVSVFLVDKKNDFYKPIQQDGKLKESIQRGKEVYMDMCLRCHLANGKGVPKVYPPLAKSDYLLEKREESIRAIKYGLRGKIVVNGKPYRSIMTKPGLDDDEVADVMNYITNSWGNTYDKMVTEKEVAAVPKKKKS